MVCVRRPGSRIRACRPAGSRSRPSTDGCSRRPNAARGTKGTRRSRGGRGHRGRVYAAVPGRRGARADLLSRSRCRATRRRLRNTAGLYAARRTRREVAHRTSRCGRIRRPQVDRNLLHAAAARRLPGARRAGSRSSRRDTRADPRSARARSVDGQRRISCRRLPLSSATPTRPRSWRTDAALPATSAPRERASIRRPSPSGASSAWTSIRWRFSLPGCRSG